MLKNIIETFFKNNFSKTPKAIAVGVSGGIDSLALTFLLNEYALENKIKLHAITIDHKMRKASSKEALKLNKMLQKNKINHQILEINSDDIPKKNIEANLRKARYNLLYDYCTKQKITHLFLGHHLGDAAENFLIRLFRGSQLDGLSAMQEILQYKQIKLLRPFIDVTKDDLKKYLQDKKITHFEDESNEDEKFLRNKIRKFFEQFEDKNLIQKRIKNAAQTIKESKDFIDEILLQEAAKCLVFNPEGSFEIDVEKYQKIPPKIALKILSLLLMEISGNPYKPRFEGLNNFEKNILSLKKGQKKNFYGCMAQNLRGRLIIYRDETEKKNPTQKLDEKTVIIDGRFLAKINKKPHKFYFRTILGRVFDV